MAIWTETCPFCFTDRTIDNNDGGMIVTVDCLKCGKHYYPKHQEWLFSTTVKDGRVTEFKGYDKRDIQGQA
jgi:Zn ribbon nucleic-acid-binding protein